LPADAGRRFTTAYYAIGRYQRMSQIRLELSALIYQEDSVWIAHCLQMDIAAEGETPEEALTSLIGLVDCQIEDAVNSGNVDSLFNPAPPAIWRLFALGKDSAKMPPKQRPATNRINRFSIRELAFA
jgi:predicted RNase H-like HicB family nuclease